VVEGARLESVFRGNSNVGSNPTLSASYWIKSTYGSCYTPCDTFRPSIIRIFPRRSHQSQQLGAPLAESLTSKKVPRDPRFRRLLKARLGLAILSADYAAMELRLAATFANRAITDFHKRISSENDGWLPTKYAPMEPRCSRD
jgi:hypothetical protein